jgi:hypothetical protein
MYYKYLSPDRCDVICNLKVRFTQPGGLNDPFEAVPLLMDYDDPYWRKRESGLAAKAGKSQIDVMGFTVGVLSLSRTKENLLLWSHYADEHRGYVIEFDEKNDFFKADAERISCKPILVSYTSQRPVINMSDIKEHETLFDFHPEDLPILLGHKSIDWAYEEEVRVFRNISSLPSYGTCKYDYDIKLVEIPSDAISGIYFGANMDDEVQQKIKEACHRKGLNIPMYKATLSFDSYSLGFSPV